jgi:hypothetical protein
MRALILAAGAALALGACGNNDQADNTLNVDENLTAENIVANDVTAIDAVTADAANMAADVDINFTNDMLGSGGNAADTQGPARSSRPAQRRTQPARPSSPPPAAEPATNSAATNSTE